ncbi:PAS domain S-box protein [Aneurinibacillus sp. Ricciae_BoGa-3]|uniref:PAS domain-containing protein n=1 Tax=Aneurinibacillus sp. Ricciae_BoGa-3 TaxID=3022697 RepID=UPI002341A14D|nr:PAS domain-containing protein [Aneurinibacillus sp. Ricciae_BoGa-3]WCK55860.1 PAS domain S-box protein [Aneurinibacillus sp. Ricciae_BoGa-3]
MVDHRMDQTALQAVSILESISEAFFSIDNAWRFTYLNKEAERFIRRNRHELIGKIMWEEFPEDFCTKYANDTRRVLKEQVSIELEDYFSSLNKWFLVRLSPIENGLCIYFRDITKLKQSHLELLQTLEKNAQMISAVANTTTGVTISNPRLPDNPLIYVNEGFTRLTGYSKEEVLQKNSRFLQGKNTDLATVNQVREAMNKGVPVTVEMLNYRKDGEPFWNELSITPVFDEEGKLLYFVGLQIDVTRRKLAEQQLKKELEFAKHVQQSVLSPSLVTRYIEIDAAYIPSEQLAGICTAGMK